MDNTRELKLYQDVGADWAYLVSRHGKIIDAGHVDDVYRRVVEDLFGDRLIEARLNSHNESRVRFGLGDNIEDAIVPD